MHSQKSFKNASAETVSIDLKSAVKKGAFNTHKHQSYYICGFNRTVAQLSVGLPYTSAFRML